jgi:Tol biopolymer transport system component
MVATTGVLGVALALPAGAQAVFPGQNNEIVFVSGIGQAANVDSRADLFVNQLGDLTFAENEALTLTLTSGPATAQVRHPSISPDGTKIAFALKVPGDGTGHGNIYIHDRTDGSTSVMWDSPNIDDDRPAWSPDNRHVAFESEASDGQEYEIRIFDSKESAGALPVNLTQTNDLHEGKPVWSPDGQFIYYSRGISSTNEDIVRQPADQIGVAPTNVVATGEAEYQPALSPDGTQLCYTRGPFGSANADIYIRSSATGSSGTSGSDLSDTAAGGFNCAWSPDGTRIAWVNGVFTNGALVSEPSTDGTATALVNDTDDHFDGNPDYARLPKKCQGQPASIIGTGNVDDLVGFEFRDVFQALGDDDNAVGKEGRDRMCGKGGKDNLVGGPDNDTLYGEGGADTLKGAEGNDKCFGGPGDDTFKSCEKAVE